MPGKLNVYKLGDVGVDVVDGPLTGEPNEFSQAQNAQPSPIELGGGLKKRDGISRLSTTASGSEVLAIFNVCFPDP